MAKHLRQGTKELWLNKTDRIVKNPKEEREEFQFLCDYTLETCLPSLSAIYSNNLWFSSRIIGTCYGIWCSAVRKSKHEDQRALRKPGENVRSVESIQPPCLAELIEDIN